MHKMKCSKKVAGQQKTIPGGSAHNDQHKEKQGPETTIKTAAPVLLSVWCGRVVLKVRALWGFKHTTGTTKEK